ncbi:hypothetical protein RND71_026323 [Anisodus tanguticus]|uniref:Uncharacterized protein n=1 Tax=Anisodus tanguticus TaxID=243964 RepID=A0AAE1VAD9_9SOLA|nr:hypothetical protein RND71_026323 [Anisodus tanguticus]
MGFIMEKLILRLMEDPKEMWSYPLRPYGFWDPQISQVAGRRDSYDDLLQDGASSSKSLFSSFCSTVSRGKIKA